MVALIFGVIFFCPFSPIGRVTNDIVDGVWLNFTIPLEEKADNFLAEKGSFEKCRMYKKSKSFNPNLNLASCTPEYFMDKARQIILLSSKKYIRYSFMLVLTAYTHVPCIQSRR